MSQEGKTPGSGRFGLFCALGGAAIGVAIAAWLSGHLHGVPGIAPRDDVVGYLHRHGVDKSHEMAFFYAALLLAPIGGLLASRRATRRVARQSAKRVVDALLGSSGAVGRFLEPRVDRATLGAVLLPWLAAVLSITVFALAVGPRVAAPMPLGDGLLRVVTVLAAATGLTAGIAAMAAWLGLSVAAGANAARHLTWLLAARFAPDTPAVVWTSVGLAGLGFLASIAMHRRDHGVDPEAARRALPRFFRTVFLPALVVALLFHRSVHGDLDLYHAGESLVPGAALLDGAVPYRDVYLQHGLLQNAVRPWLTFEAFGPTYAVEKRAEIVSYAVAHAAFLALLLATLRSWFVAVALTLAIASPGLLVSPRLTFLFVALACAARHLRVVRDGAGTPGPHRLRRWPFLAGVATAIAVLHSVDTGLYAAASIGVFLLIEATTTRRSEPLGPRLASFGWFVLGVGTGAAPFVIPLVALGAGAAFVQNTREQVTLQLAVWGLPFPPARSLWETLRSEGAAAALGSPLFLAGLSAAGFVAAISAFVVRAANGAARRIDWTVLLLALAGAALFRSALGRSDAGHLVYPAALLWPVLAVAAEGAWRGGFRSRDSRESSFSTRPPHRSIIVRAVPFGLLAGFLIATHAPLYGAARQWLRLSEVQVTSPGGGFSFATLPRLDGVLIPDDQARALSAMAGWLEERLPAGAPVFEFSNMGAIHFLLDRPCPTRFVHPVYAATPRLQRELVLDLERSRPRFMITSGLLGRTETDGIPLAERLPIVAAYLAKTYRPYEETGFGAVYERVDPPSATEALGDRMPDQPTDGR